MVIVLVVLVAGGLVWLARRPRREIPRSAAGEPGVPAQEYASRAVPGELRPRGRIEVSGLTKVYDGVAVVDDVSFTAEPGRVTGFLGPNGAGKTTTLRMLLGLVQPSSGVALIGRSRYVEMERPVVWVGAVLEASGAHEGRSGRDHLRVLCRAAGLPESRGTRCWRRSDWRRPAAGRSGGTPSACGSGSGWRRPCSETRRC